MSSKNMGFIKWPRDIAFSDLKKNPYAYTLYSYCCSKANFQSVVSKETNFEKGSFPTSRNNLHDELGWDKKTIDKSLDQLVKLHLIVKESDKRGTKITIIDYEKFQGNHEKVVEEIHHNQIESGGRYPPQSQKGGGRYPPQSQKGGGRYPPQSQKGGGRYPPKVVDEIHPNKNIYKNNINSRAEHDTSSDEIKRIIDYLNEKANKNFKPGSRNTKRYITARLKEGYTFDDFKRVIDTKCSQWIGDPKMERYLRPETLFGNKFEGYLNEKGKAPAHKSEFRLPDA